MTWRWSLPAVVCISAATAMSGCANKANMTELELVEFVDGTKIEDWKPVGNQAIDAAGIGLVQEAREWQKESKVLEQQMNASGPLAVLSRSVDAELQKRGISSPTEAQREEVTTEVMSWMQPAEREQLRAAIAANQALAKQQDKDGAIFMDQLGKVSSEVLKIINESQAGKEWWEIAADQAGPVMEAKKQLDVLGEFFDTGRELIHMYEARLSNLDKIAAMVAKAEGQNR